jgi:hypothetical protein
MEDQHARPRHAPRQARLPRPQHGRSAAAARAHFASYAQFRTPARFLYACPGHGLSDRSHGIVAFLHAAGGSYHHIFGFIVGDRPGYHHASFEVANIDEIGLGATRLIDKGYRGGWGFGRHVIGSNLFYYVRDPWNSLAEYFCDIDYIPAGMDWQATNYSPENALYV